MFLLLVSVAGQLERIYKWCQHPCGSEDGKACNQVDKRYQDAFTSGSQESIVHFKTFKKDGFGVSGCTRGVETRRGYQKTEAVRGRVAGGVRPVIVSRIRELFVMNTDDRRAHVYTLCPSVKLPQHCPQIETRALTIKPNKVYGDMNAPTVIVLKNGSVTPQKRQRKKSLHIFFFFLHGRLTV